MKTELIRAVRYIADYDKPEVLDPSVIAELKSVEAVACAFQLPAVKVAFYVQCVRRTPPQRRQFLFKPLPRENTFPTLKLFEAGNHSFNAQSHDGRLYSIARDPRLAIDAEVIGLAKRVMESIFA